MSLQYVATAGLRTGGTKVLFCLSLLLNVESDVTSVESGWIESGVATVCEAGDIFEPLAKKSP